MDGDNVVLKPQYQTVILNEAERSEGTLSKDEMLHCVQHDNNPSVILNETKCSEGSQDEMLHCVQHDKKGRVYINDTQYFDNVPEVAWHFYIGGYQPAQKWLKDRKGRKLEFEDILHYQKIVVALYETYRLMNEIDKIDSE